jgi:uncharacterized protein YqfA (UPF0365 family)
MDDRSFKLGVAVGVAVVLLLQFILLVFKPWRRAFFSGAAVPLANIVGMRLRGNPPMLLVDAFILLRKHEVDVSIDMVEVVYVTNRTRASSPEALMQLVQEKKQTNDRQHASAT